MHSRALPIHLAIPASPQNQGICRIPFDDKLWAI
jgi:hypothetical protein